MTDIAIEVQFFSLLSGELSRSNFNAAGGASWTTAPPLTVNGSQPGYGKADVPNRATVDVTYHYPNADRVDFFVGITQTDGTIRANTVASKHGYACTSRVTGDIVAVTFKQDPAQHP